MRTFVLGDVHGRHAALVQVLERVNFNYDEDRLIVLGDIVDGGYNTSLVVEELLKIKNLIYIIGNHDEWFMNHICSGWAEEIWLQQGGANTLKSYGASVLVGKTVSDSSLLDTTKMNIPCTHQDFFNRGKYYHIEDNMVFVHGGFDPELGIEDTSKNDLLWDRALIQYAREGNKVLNRTTMKPYDAVFVGHTTTEKYGAKPILHKNLWQIDCGAGWQGRLCIMNIDTKEYVLSDWQNAAVR